MLRTQHGLNILEAIGAFFVTLFRSILRDLMVLAIVFVIATAISVGVCLYYGLPLALSLLAPIPSVPNRITTSNARYLLSRSFHFTKLY